VRKSDSRDSFHGPEGNLLTLVALWATKVNRLDARRLMVAQRPKVDTEILDRSRNTHGSVDFVPSP